MFYLISNRHLCGLLCFWPIFIVYSPQVLFYLHFWPNLLGVFYPMPLGGRIASVFPLLLDSNSARDGTNPPFQFPIWHLRGSKKTEKTKKPKKSNTYLTKCGQKCNFVELFIYIILYR